MADDAERYSAEFYEGQQAGSYSSADRVVPFFLSLFPCKSIVDVGCGVGGWLKVFEKHGVNDYLGIDGDYVPRDMLKIPREKFRAQDLSYLKDIGQFDVACTLEVAEHLPEESADSFIAALVNAAPVVLFSAAIPRQGGTGHINEQWQSYWHEKFASYGYVAVDCIRPAIYGDERVCWWYRQNVIVYCRPEKVPAGQTPMQAAYDLNRVDPFLLNEMSQRRYYPYSGTEALDMMRHCVWVLWKAAKARSRRVVGL